MSVTIKEVIESGGYDLTSLEDARWLLGQQTQFNELVEEAEETVEKLEAEADDED